ncbi:Cupin 2 conserved barrel domain protein [Thermobaculum terrenum ATCC BAA-798]|uniref:Cupin 2 conserved barrel domain protein n=1 Tax=Thermobaculum terrenum (strain ATCC BAA-798 / CCMEE 7001 / YNP1) TaxID=525904 RepID=D1CH20_THET1|nr:cupin domain-containing protein [Thermobaculum terrenum]ACZ43041.1 Cupin 2 conserved barrel domain protein [Thermobaculum terrenum ATCC BAA-798]
MSYVQSPRPRYDAPTYIPSNAAVRHLWGDEVSGEVADRIYVSSDLIHQLVFNLPPGGAFRHSADYRTIFAADEVYYVLSGTLVLSNPERGEVHLLHPGEYAFFRKDTWHHGFSYGETELSVLEIFAPPPSQGTSSAYARTKDLLQSPSYSQDDLIGCWPMAQDVARGRSSIRIIREPDLLWRLEGKHGQLLLGIAVSTEHLTVGTGYLLPGKRSEMHSHGGDEIIYLLSGQMSVRSLHGGEQVWAELSPGDAFYVPQGCPHQYYNLSGTQARFIFGVAPSYLPDKERP